MRGDPVLLATDAITVGALGVLLAVVLLLIPSGFVQEYTIEKAGTFELSGIILGVGMFGGYAAIVAVFLGIAGLTPKRADADDVDLAWRREANGDVAAGDDRTRRAAFQAGHAGGDAGMQIGRKLLGVGELLELRFLAQDQPDPVVRRHEADRRPRRHVQLARLQDLGGAAIGSVGDLLGG